MVDRISVSVDFGGQHNRFFPAEIGNQPILPVLFLKTEPVNGIDIFEIAAVCPIDFVSVLIDQHFGVVCNIAVLGRTDRQFQIAVIYNLVQTTAIKERTTANARDIIRNLNARQTGATEERPIANTHDTVGYNYIC